MRWWLVVALGVVGTMAGPVWAADCNGNAVADADEIASGALADCDGNGVPDGCDLFPIAFDRTILPVPPGQPLGIVAEDLDADGDEDLAVTHGASALVSVLLGAGDGTFTAGDTTVVGTTPTAIAAGLLEDFVSLDGSATNLFVSNAGSDSVMRLGNDGDAGFSADFSIGVGDFPVDLALGTVFPASSDIVVANRTDSTLTVLRYSGLGSYTPQPPIATATGPQALSVTDVTRDGRGDVLVASRTAGQLTLHRNNGAGTLLAAESAAAVTDPVALAAADFTGDGEVDVVVASFDGSTIGLFEGDGTGSFTAAGSIAVAGKPLDVALADLDGDGYRDLVATVSATNLLAVALNTRLGGFGPVTYLETGSAPATVVAQDLNRDSRPDLVVSNALDGTLGIYLQRTAPAARDCNTTSVPDQCELAGADCNANAVPDPCDLSGGFRFSEPVTTPLDTRVDALASGDFDGDGDADVAYLARGANELRLLRRLDDGTLTAWTATPFAAAPLALVAADLEPDGDVDLAVTLFGGSIAVVRNLGGGTFDVPTIHPVGIDARFLLAVGMNADPALDLVAASQDFGGDTIAVLRNTGTGFAAPTSLALPAVLLNLAPIDFEDDGDTDLMGATFAGGSSLRIVLNDGTGTLSLGPAAPSSPPEFWLAGVAGDVVQSAATDLVTVQVTASADLRLAIFPGLGGGGYPDVSRTFPIPLPTTPGGLGLGLLFGAAPGLAIADFDGDGDGDLVVTDNARPSLKAFARVGTDLAEITNVPLPEAPGLLAVGDVDRDGIPDLVLAGRSKQLHTVRSLARPTSQDCLGSGVPDECEFAETDCNANRVPDTCELPATDLDGNAVPDCAERAANCANCLDDDADGGRDLADESCPATALAVVRAKASRGNPRKGGRLRITADVPALLATLTSGSPTVAVELGGASLYCGPVTFKGKRNSFRLTGASGALKTLVASLRKKKAQTRLRLVLQDPAIAVSPGATVRVSLQGDVGPYTGARTTP